jgi:hypothetical protein
MFVIIVVAFLQACVPGSPVYFGPPVVTLEGDVAVFETGQALPGTEVCVFGADTLCLPADAKGHYWAQFREQTLLEDGAVTVRFRPPGLPAAIAELRDLVAGQKTTLDCAISDRVTLAGGPLACRPIQR